MSAEFETSVEAVRIGTIFAHNQKAYGRWQRTVSRRSGEQGLAGEALEAAVMGLARRNPEYVVVGG